MIWPPRDSAPRQAAPSNEKKPVSIGTTGVALLDEQAEHEDQTLKELQRGEEWAEIRRRYGECLAHVVDVVAPVLTKYDIGTDPQTIAAIAATLFIERNRRGV